MKRISLLALTLTLAGLLAACAPVIIVENNTGFPVRVIVSTSQGRTVVSPSPGESSTVEAAAGSYRATAIPDAEWIEYAKLTRKVLNDQLANADKLTGPQLLDVIRHLKDIAVRMQQFEQAAGAGASCGGALASDAEGNVSDGLVNVSQAPDGSLVVSCK